MSIPVIIALQIISLVVALQIISYFIISTIQVIWIVLGKASSYRGVWCDSVADVAKCVYE